MTVFAEQFRFDPSLGRIVRQPPGPGYGNWVGGKVSYDDASGQFVLFYRDRDFRYTIDMLRAERIAPAPMVTNLISLDELPAAFQALRTPSTECKVIWTPS